MIGAFFPTRGETLSNIYEVAKRAQVSTATVSRVLSRPDVVSPDTRRRVMDAVNVLGYAPNSAAKHLRTLRSGQLLVTVPDISNPFFSLILRGIEEAASTEGYAVLLGDTQHDEAREERYALMLRRKEADGLIFLGHRLPRAAVDLLRASPDGCAAIVNGCELSPHLGIACVQIDNAAAAREAIHHLFELGHRRIGVVTGPHVSPHSRDRLNGVKQYAAETGGAGLELIVMHGDFTIESGSLAGDHLLALDVPPTAIFCFNDEMAVGVLGAARRRNLTVPSDLSLVGFDDVRYAAHTNPPLTTIAQPMQQIGEVAVRLLLDIISGRMVVPQTETLPHALVVRSSTAPPTS
jgi:LacI family repressor for deo operon, udp, cdd, tsx, nupC, and nupG